MKNKKIEIRNVNFKLMTYTRSLELCAQMNYETEVLDFIDDIPQGDVLYDLGACEGRFSIYAVFKGINVVAFEPEENNFKVLRQNYALNNLTNNDLKLINAGVGSVNGNAIMKIGQPWEGGHQKVVEHNEIRSDLDFDFKENQQIKLISLDTFLQLENNPFPNYLKVDVDGSELPFLQGAKTTLENDKLKSIIFELSEADSNFKLIIETLTKSGFIESKRYPVPNEPTLFNIVFKRANESA